MDSRDLAGYIESIDGISKPWLLLQLRLAKLKERRSEISATEYAEELESLQQDLLKMGEWWKGQEEAVFKTGL
jgi:polyphosphate kinase 2 (PPK2 family)